MVIYPATLLMPDKTSVAVRTRARGPPLPPPLRWHCPDLLPLPPVQLAPNLPVPVPVPLPVPLPLLHLQVTVMRSLGSIWSCLGVIVLLFLMKIKGKKKFDRTAAAQRRQVSTTLTLLGLRRARARVMRVGAGIAGHVRLVASMRAHVRAHECCARMTLPCVALILPGD